MDSYRIHYPQTPWDELLLLGTSPSMYPEEQSGNAEFPRLFILCHKPNAMAVLEIESSQQSDKVRRRRKHHQNMEDLVGAADEVEGAWRPAFRYTRRIDLQTLSALIKSIPSI